MKNKKILLNWTNKVYNLLEFSNFRLLNKDLIKYFINKFLDEIV